ncbi:MAG: hypothetical protein JWO11_984 [Nocardioides sp.]|nr:hypothetical protein [Nocardioides sp.]
MLTKARAPHVHNDRMNRVLAHGVAVLLGAALLAGCSSSGDSKGNPTPSTSTSGGQSATGSSTPPAPPGVELTPQGTQLALGDDAVVAWQPTKNTPVGVLDIKVTRLERTTFKQSFVGWKLNDATKKSTPYFVYVTVGNVGETQLGGRPVPLYIVDGTNTLIEPSSFASKFGPCPSTPFPKQFGPGDNTLACLVFLAPDKGKLTAVSFRPTEEFTPIVWTGEIKTIKKDLPRKGGKGNGGKGKGGQRKG